MFIKFINGCSPKRSSIQQTDGFAPLRHSYVADYRSPV